MSIDQKIKDLAELDIQKVVKQNRKGKVEENVRNIIIVELLKCLGWEKQKGDLDFEHNVQNKKADVALMIETSSGKRIPKVIIECKDLDEDLDKHIDQAFDYAINTQVNWIILSNGRVFRLYKTFIENVPDRKDHLLINPPIKLEELKYRFNELAQWISKKNVLNDKLDQLSSEREVDIRRNVNTSILNNIFITFTPKLIKFYIPKIKISYKKNKNTEKIINNWLDFKGINYKDINIWSEIYAKEAAFTIINRILLMRIIEDSHSPKIPQRLSKKGLKAWELTHTKWSYKELLNDSFNEILKIDYQSIYTKDIFDIIELTEGFLKDLVQQFAKINFQVLDSEILKLVYQEHILESERKELGQYYTPDYIIRVILNSIPLITDFNYDLPSKTLSILDPASGSGGFLTEAYDILKNNMINNNWDESLIHETILTKHLFGIDIEPFAAQFSTINLLIKDVKHPVNYIFIVIHNTLLSGGTTTKKITPIRVKKIITRESSIDNKYVEREFPLENYEVIVGNPPYFLISKREGSKSTGKKFHTTYLPSAVIRGYQTEYSSWPHDNKNPNIFYLFIERGIELLEDGGYLGYIIPDIVLSGNSTKNLRQFLLKTCKIKKIFIIDGKVFGAGITNIILIVKKCKDAKARSRNKIQIINTSVRELQENDKEGNYSKYIITPHYIQQRFFNHNPLNVFSIRMNNITSLVFASIFKKLNQKTLVKLSSIVNIQRGIENLKKKDALDAITSTKSTIRKLIAVDNIERFRIKWKAASFYQKYIDYSKSTYPKGSKVNLKQDSWFKQEKIVLKRISNKLVAALDTKKEKKEDYFYTLDSVQMIWMIDKKSYNIRLILAILNSEFMNLYYTTLFSYKKLFSKVQKIFLEELPIPVNIDPNLEKQIVDKVKKLEKKFIKKDYDELNDLVKSLYFSKDELKQFEKSLKLTYNLKDLPGLGYNHEYELNKYGIKSIDDLIKCDVNDIIDNVPGVGAKTIEKWIKYGKELNK